MLRIGFFDGIKAVEGRGDDLRAVEAVLIPGIGLTHVRNTKDLCEGDEDDQREEI